MKEISRTGSALKTSAQVLTDFQNKGISITDWAMAFGVPPSIVVDLLRGHTKGSRGKTRDVAIALGMQHKPDLPRRAA